MKRDLKTPATTRRTYSAMPRTYFDLTTEITDAMKQISANLSAIRQSRRWSFNIEGNKVFARMCADEILTQALSLSNAFQRAQIGYRDGLPLALNLPPLTLS